MGIYISDISINGGGAQSKLWCEIIADVLNVNVNKVNTSEGPAYGAAILSVGYGLFDTVEDACETFIKITETIEPNKERVDLYNIKHEKV